MRSFFKTTLAVIFGITIVIGLPILFLTFLGFLSGRFFSTEKEAIIHEGSVLELNFKNPIIETPSELNIGLLDIESLEDTPMQLYDILNALNQAREDDRITKVSMVMNSLEANYAQIKEIRDAILSFKATGKSVYAYGEMMTQKEYYLASAADSIYVGALGSVELKGLSMEVMYFKKLFDQIGVQFNALRQGKYKSAIEPFINDGMSQENRYQSKELLGDLWEVVVDEISKTRTIPREQLTLITDSLIAFSPAKAVSHKLIDGILYYDQYKELLKLGKKGNLLNVHQYNQSLVKDHKDKIAILYASGDITSGDKMGDIQDEYFIEQIQKIKEDKDVLAVVLRINSPGGSAMASEKITRELSLLAKSKPIIASFSGTAASGGYYIATQASKIVAMPNTITGSIGVFGGNFSFGTLSEKLGIAVDTVKTNVNSIYYEPLGKGISAVGKKRLLEGLQEIYKKFLERVANNRGITSEQVDSLGQGRVWSGIDAKEEGLVDELGGLQKAIDLAAAQAKITKYSVQEFPENKTKIEVLIENISSGSIDEQEVSKLLRSSEYWGLPFVKWYKQMKYFDKTKENIHLKLPYIMEIK